MNASRKFYALAVLFAACLTISAAPPSKGTTGQSTTVLDPEDLDDSFFGFPFFSNLFAPLWKLFPSFSNITPDLEVHDGNALVTLKVNEYTKDDLKVKIKNNVVIIQGEHQSKKGDHDLFAKSFYFTQPLFQKNASASEAKAELSSDGWLVVSVPLTNISEKTNEEEVSVPVTETGTAYVPPPKKETPVAAETPVLTEKDEKKEETTEKNIQDNEVVPSLA